MIAAGLALFALAAAAIGWVYLYRTNAAVEAWTAIVATQARAALGAAAGGLTAAHDAVTAAFGWLQASGAVSGVLSALDWVKSSIVAFLTSAAFQGVLVTVAGDLQGLAGPLPWYVHYPLLLVAAVLSFASHLLKLQADGAAGGATAA